MVATAEIVRHLKRELIHAILILLFCDPEFLHAYQYGIVILCADSILRRFFPRLATYSADYVEKFVFISFSSRTSVDFPYLRVLLVLIKQLGKNPCPTCFISKEDIPDMGTVKDRRRQRKQREDTEKLQTIISKARKKVFKDGIKLNNKGLNRMLDNAGSLLPVRNAFSFIRKTDPGFNFYRLFVPDLLHEFELGVWKSTFIHLVRILETLGVRCTGEFNKRYRLVSTFGTAIRRFSDNPSELKKLTARDFEDLLQCSLPVFEGLLPEPHNKIVLDLLFTLGEWHAYAKLRLHTETTLRFLEEATVNLGRKARQFRKIVCSAYATKSEFNLNTYKFHALSKYAASIRQFGTTDSYTTHIVSLD